MIEGNTFVLKANKGIFILWLHNSLENSEFGLFKASMVLEG